MGTRRKYRPDNVTGLEDRLVLSHGRAATSVILQGLQGPQAFRAGAKHPLTALVNAAYDSFEQDFRQTRSVYLSSIVDKTATPADQSAFNTYTLNRVQLLAQQVINSLLLYQQGTTRGHRVGSPLPVIAQRIDGTVPKSSPPQFAQGTLGASLIAATPAPGASPTSTSLANLAQDNAIESSLVASINGVTIVRNGDFGNGKAGH